MLMQSAVMLWPVIRLSVCLSVCLSLPLVCPEHIVMNFLKIIMHEHWPGDRIAQISSSGIITKFQVL